MVINKIIKLLLGDVNIFCYTSKFLLKIRKMCVINLYRLLQMFGICGVSSRVADLNKMLSQVLKEDAA